MSKSVQRRAARRQADLLSVKSLAEYLREIAAKPVMYVQDSALHAALRSQGSMAKYAIPDASIHSMSLNHQRLIAELSLGSYDVLNNLRRAAMHALDRERTRTARGTTPNKAELLERVHELESEIELIKQDLALIQRAYDLRCLQARTYAEAANASTQALCAKEQKELDATFSLRRKPSKPTNVVEMGKHV